MSAWTAAILNSFCMFLRVMQWICHCVQRLIDSVGVFVWALAPFFGFCCVFCCLLRFFRWRNASLAGGFAGRRFLFGCGSRFCCFYRFADSKDLLSLYSVFPAYSHVRTEPLARHRPHSRKKKYDMKRDSVEINHNAPQRSHNAVWNRKYMEPKQGYTLRQLWADSQPAIEQKSSLSQRG